MNKKFWKAAGVRAIKTICQVAVALISTNTFMTDIDWLGILSASSVAGIVSILTSIATGLPEVESED